MNHLVFQDQFTDLESGQRGLLWEYYRLVTGALPTSEKELDGLVRIWGAAENDPVLSKWLSLIDLLYTNVPFSYEADDDDRRAYLSEYIELLVDENPDHTNTRGSKEFNEDEMCNGSRKEECILICPDGSGYVRKSCQEMNSMNAAERENWSCDRCKGTLREHRISCAETPVC